jgi:two-component system alkaline phosphatase synthesis response regulator PhoP
MNNYTVLVVDDEPNIVTIMSYELKKEGYTVLTAGDGQQALDLAKSQRPDLIIADVMMPVMDGYELCRRLKENAALRAIPFIFLTAKDGMESQVYGYAIGAQKYLTKPTKREQLLKIVNLRLKAAGDARALFAKKAKKFDGDLAVISVFSLLDMYYIGGWTGAVEMRHPDGRTGRIEISDAEITKCSIDGAEDGGTFTQLLTWNQGLFAASHE